MSVLVKKILSIINKFLIKESLNVMKISKIYLIHWILKAKIVEKVELKLQSLIFVWMPIWNYKTLSWAWTIALIGYQCVYIASLQNHLKILANSKLLSICFSKSEKKLVNIMGRWFCPICFKLFWILKKHIRIFKKKG